MNATPPDNPAGRFQPVAEFDLSAKTALIESIRQAPVSLRAAVSGLTENQLDTPYKNWTIRQITHHIADSHLHSIIRFKWALTEDHPTIKAYEEGDWVQLADCRNGDIEPSLTLLDGLHAKWIQLLETMTEQQFARTFHHPQTGATVSLWLTLNNYAWHSRHHTAQILWLREHHGWDAKTDVVASDLDVSDLEPRREVMRTAAEDSEHHCDVYVVERLTERQVFQLHELIQQQWWGRRRSLEDVKVMIDNTSLMIGLVEHSTDRLVGFCRTLTDFAFRATVYDVMVEQQLQGTGLGKRLLDAMCGHPKLQNASIIYLACEPALFPFYKRWGFTECEGRSEWMAKVQREEQ